MDQVGTLQTIIKITRVVGVKNYSNSKNKMKKTIFTNFVKPYRIYEKKYLVYSLLLIISIPKPSILNFLLHLKIMFTSQMNQF